MTSLLTGMLENKIRLTWEQSMEKGNYMDAFNDLFLKSDRISADI